MVKRNLKDNTRKTKNRKRRKLIVIGAEGSNVTEATYFKHFGTKDIEIKMATGNSTDPVGIVSDTVKMVKNRAIDIQHNDVAVYCVFDTDADSAKCDQIRKSIELAKKYGINVITSTPCFENWFLCHYELTTAPMDNKNVIGKLKKHIKKYDKNMDVYPIINSFTEKAVENAKKQCEYHIQQGNNIKSPNANPATEVYEIIEYIWDKCI